MRIKINSFWNQPVILQNKSSTHAVHETLLIAAVISIVQILKILIQNVADFQSYVI